MSPLAAVVFLPIILALLVLVLHRRLAPIIGFLGAIVIFQRAIVTFKMTLGGAEPVWLLAEQVLFKADRLTGFIILFIGLFGLLISLYALGTIREKHGLKKFWFGFLATLGASAGVVLSVFPGAIEMHNIIALMVFWGFLGFTLYILISTGGRGAPAAAKKAFVIIGATDALMIIGIILYRMLVMNDGTLPLPITGELSAVAFIFLLLAALAKAGAFPVHTWIPDAAESSPAAVTAFLPAALDKLVGIYFLVRLVQDYFVISGTPMQYILMLIGAITIVAAVMMALVQHNLYRLLGYHAVSQVGYMVLSIALLTPLGIAAGLFHMLNNTIYKAALFLTAGAVKQRTGTLELDQLGALGKAMPITFLVFLIAALAISGVPPLNGFVSKWMIYQSLVDYGAATPDSKVWVIWLTAAMFGSALTLASFVKVIHAVFLGRPEGNKETKVKETMPLLWIPSLLLAGLCVLFGVWARLPLAKFINYDLAELNSRLGGGWEAGTATVLLLVGIGIGLLIYAVGTGFKIRRDIPYQGGEVHEEQRLSGAEFYRTIETSDPFDKIYALAKAGWFDLYEVGSRILFYVVDLGKAAHSGLLSTYVAWTILGLGGILLALMGAK